VDSSGISAIEFDVRSTTTPFFLTETREPIRVIQQGRVSSHLDHDDLNYVALQLKR
jgi:hypothetical protein